MSAVHWRVLPGTRDLLALAAANPRRYPCLLESAARGTQSRYDMLFAFPADAITLHRDGRVRDAAGNDCSPDFLAALDAAWRTSFSPSPLAGEGLERGGILAQHGEGNLPFSGGWVLFLGYELAAGIEPSLHLPDAPDPRIPVALALRCPAAIIIDHQANLTRIVAEAGHAHLCAELHADLESAVELAAAPTNATCIEEDPPQRFLDGVARIHGHLRAGDVFQVNLSREWRARFDTPPQHADVYANLRSANPAPFGGLLQWEDWSIASSSPERLIEVRDGIAQTRPIAGTRARRPGDDDAVRVRELIGHAKERAEHVMLIDLERNDLGRICVPGSIAVDQMMTVESYAHVHHIVSNVRGRLRPDVTPGAAIAAVFPGGTITGCPKVRCMRIIAELEGVGRGAYTGALGYLDRGGNMDLNILIRTIAICGGHARLRAGAGIVADSVAAQELEETRAKARGLLRALGASA
jgi:anthranilate synthase component 1